MKWMRTLGGFLCFIGILAAMVGILATAVPMIENDQVKRIVESFSLQSADQMLNTVNQVILYCLANGSLLFGAGAITLLIGGLMKSGAERSLFRSEPAKQPAKQSAQRKAETRDINRPAPTTTARETLAPAKGTPIATPGYSPPSAARTASIAQRSSDLFSAPPTEEKYRPRSIIDLTNEPEPSGSLIKDAYSDNREETPKAANETATERATDPVYVARYQVGPSSTYCAECGAENLLEQPVCSRCGQKLQVAPDLQPQGYPRAATHAAETTDSMENRRSAYVAPTTARDTDTPARQTQSAMMQTGEKLENAKFHAPMPKKDPWTENSAGRGAQSGEQLNGVGSPQTESVNLAGSLLTQRNAQNSALNTSTANDPRYAQPLTGTASEELAKSAESVPPYGRTQAAGTAPLSPDEKEPFRANEENAKPRSHIRIVSTMGKHSV